MKEIKNKLSHFRKRLNDMRGEREPFEDQWYFNQLQTEAQSYEDWEKFYPNTKLEQAVIEMRLWSKSWDVIFDVEPDEYEPNIDEALIAKHTLAKFMHEEEWHRQLRYRRHNKAVSGTGIWFCGISHDIVCDIKREEIEIKPQIWNWYFESKGKKKVYKEKWYFMPQDVPANAFYIDDGAMEQPDFERAVDCIMCEFGDKDDIVAKYKEVPWVDVKALEALQPRSSWESEYWQDVKHWQIVLYHYFNKVTRDWFIVGNEEAIIYETYYEFACDGLPFVVCQHHPRNNKMYGIWEPEAISALKATKNATWQAIVNGTMMASGKLLLAWNSWEFTDSMDDSLKVYSWEITIKDVTNSVENYKEISTDINMSSQLNLLELIDQEVRYATGIDVKSAFEAPEQNLWQTEIKEENKAIRLKAIDELEDIAIGKALTIALANIAKFAPVLKQGSKEIDVNGVMKEVASNYVISLPDVKVVKKKDKKYVEEDLGNHWQLEFTEWMISGKNKVRVTTWSTNNSKLNALEKNKVIEMTNIVSNLSQVYWPEAVLDLIPLEMIWWRVNEAFGYGTRDTQVKSKQQKIKDENTQMLNNFKSLIASMLNVANSEWLQQNPTWEGADWGLQRTIEGWGKEIEWTAGWGEEVLWLPDGTWGAWV